MWNGQCGMSPIARSMCCGTPAAISWTPVASGVRPRLMLLTYLTLGGTDLEYIAKPAAAVELMHTASVVHDDINDHGILRRGRPSVNAIWGRTFALLTGDFLFTAVYELMAPYGDLNVDLAQAATALVEGETLQASAVKRQPLHARNLHGDHRLEDGRLVSRRERYWRQIGRGRPVSGQGALRFRLQGRFGISDCRRHFGSCGRRREAR